MIISQRKQIVHLFFLTLLLSSFPMLLIFLLLLLPSRRCIRFFLRLLVLLARLLYLVKNQILLRRRPSRRPMRAFSALISARVRRSRNRTPHLSRMRDCGMLNEFLRLLIWALRSPGSVISPASRNFSLYVCSARSSVVQGRALILRQLGIGIGDRGFLCGYRRQPCLL